MYYDTFMNQWWVDGWIWVQNRNTGRWSKQFEIVLEWSGQHWYEKIIAVNYGTR